MLHGRGMRQGGSIVCGILPNGVSAEAPAGDRGTCCMFVGCGRVGALFVGSYPTASPLKHQLKQECHA